MHRGVKGGKGFYAVYGELVATAAAVVLTPGSPLGLLTEDVQTLAGVLLPSASVSLLLLCRLVIRGGAPVQTLTCSCRVAYDHRAPSFSRAAATAG